MTVSPRRVRHALFAAATIVAVALLYEVALNVFLMTGALGHVLSGNPDKLLVTYASGWSLVPGHVHARRLRIRSKDGNVEMDLRIERCDFHVALGELLRRRFHATRVRGDDVTFVARMRLDAKDATPKRLETLPAIEGLEPVPLRDPPTPPPDDAHYRLFTVALDDVDARAVHEIWIDGLRFRGDARVVGGFFLRPIRWASVGPVTAYLDDGRLTVGNDVVAGEVEGRIDVAIAGFDPRVTQGPEVLRHSNGRVDLQARFPSVAFLRRWVGPALEPRDGRGSFDVHVGVDDGIGRGRAAFALEETKVTVSGGEDFSGRLRGQISLDRWSLEKGTVDVSNVRVSASDVTAPGGKGGYWANIDVPRGEVDLRGGPAIEAHVAVAARDTRPFAGMLVAAGTLPPWVGPLATAGDPRATARLWLNLGTGAIDVRDLNATAGSFRLRAAGSKRASTSRVVASIGLGPLDVGVESAGGDVRVQLGGIDDWYEQRSAALFARPTARDGSLGR